MVRAEIEEIVINGITKIVEEDGEVTIREPISAETKLEVLGVNSLSIVKFVVMLEDEFDVEFEDEKLKRGKFVTVEDLINCVMEMLENETEE